MTILINLLGQPSSGKTSLAAKLFSKLKSMGMNAEYVNEYVKGWAWEGREMTSFDQLYIFGKEAHNQSKLFNKVDIIISDSPVMLATFYQYFLNGKNSLQVPCHYFYDTAEELGVQAMNFFLPRRKKYSSKGRYQTEQEADELAKQLKTWLYEENFYYEELNCPDKERLEIIMERLEGITHNFEGFNIDDH